MHLKCNYWYFSLFFENIFKCYFSHVCLFFKYFRFFRNQKTKQKKELGRILLRGDNITLIRNLEYFLEKQISYFFFKEHDTINEVIEGFSKIIKNERCKDRFFHKKIYEHPNLDKILLKNFFILSVFFFFFLFASRLFYLIN